MIAPNPIRFFLAMLRAIGHGIIGPVMVDDRTLEIRRAICSTCAFYDPEWRQCTKCGCLISFKTQLSTEKCPVGKWQKKLTLWRFLTTLYSNARRLKRRI